MSDFKVLMFLGGSWAPPGAETFPKSGPKDQLSNAEVSSESGHWRPDWWQKCVLRKSQKPVIVGAKYSKRRVNISCWESFLFVLNVSVRCFRFVGLPGHRGGRKRTLREKWWPVQGSTRKSEP